MFFFRLFIAIHHIAFTVLRFSGAKDFTQHTFFCVRSSRTIITDVDSVCFKGKRRYKTGSPSIAHVITRGSPLSLAVYMNVLYHISSPLFRVECGQYRRLILMGLVYAYACFNVFFHSFRLTNMSCVLRSEIHIYVQRMAVGY